MRQIRKAAVIGSGVMGAGIAAHLANAGIPSLLLDLVPESLTEAELAKGLTLEHPAVRNRLATDALKRLQEASPAPLYVKDFAARITPGNLDDDLGRIVDVDWVIEVIVERLEPKRVLLERIERHWRPGMMVSSNTSGISINAMVAGRGEGFRQHFLGTHFFNPPRYMKLLEIIPGQQTDATLVQDMVAFCTRRLGKGVVVAKDTPNFVANRIGTYGLLVTLQEMLAHGYSVEEVDAVTGPALGRPRSATFRTLDLVGIDTFVHVANNVVNQVDDASEKAAFHVPTMVAEMVSRGWIGEKAGQGFYKKVKGPAGSVILSLDLETLDYREQNTVRSASLDAAQAVKGASAKTQALLAGNDPYSALAWNILKRVLIYSAAKVGEIADSPFDLDQAMKWGFNWDLGPFETWDALGLVPTAERMEKEGLPLPLWVRDWIAKGHTSFYEVHAGQQFVAGPGEPRALSVAPDVLDLRALKRAGRVVKENSGANLIDLGDGVACLEFHSPNNAIGTDILTMIQQALPVVREHFEGLVIANQARNFCVGANLMLVLMEAQNGEWDEVDAIIRLFQNTMMSLKHFEKPVVAAPHRMTLGGGVEVCLAADRILPAAETYYGLVEVGVGLIPAGGGCKEMAYRLSQALPHPDDDLQPGLNRIFETIGRAKVSGSGHEAIQLGLMAPTDWVIINQDAQIHEAKQEVLRLVAAGYAPPEPAQIRVAGRDGAAVLEMGVYNLRLGGDISDHDVLIANKLAHVLAGGDVPAGSMVTEQYLLDLEREAFSSLCGERKTQERIQHILATGKPLRN